MVPTELEQHYPLGPGLNRPESAHFHPICISRPWQYCADIIAQGLIAPTPKQIYLVAHATQSLQQCFLWAEQSSSWSPSISLWWQEAFTW